MAGLPRAGEESQIFGEHQSVVTILSGAMERLKPKARSWAASVGTCQGGPIESVGEDCLH